MTEALWQVEIFKRITVETSWRITHSLRLGFEKFITVESFVYSLWQVPEDTALTGRMRPRASRLD